MDKKNMTEYIKGNADLIPPNDKRCDKIRERGRWV